MSPLQVVFELDWRSGLLSWGEFRDVERRIDRFNGCNGSSKGTLQTWRAEEGQKLARGCVVKLRQGFEDVRNVLVNGRRNESQKGENRQKGVTGERRHTRLVWGGERERTTKRQIADRKSVV